MMMICITRLSAPQRQSLPLYVLLDSVGGRCLNLLSSEQENTFYIGISKTVTFGTLSDFIAPLTFERATSEKYIAHYASLSRKHRIILLVTLQYIAQKQQLISLITSHEIISIATNKYKLLSS